MIVATYVVCNEERLIGESIRSVAAYVDRFVILDVVFRANPLRATHSTDRTRAVAEAAAGATPLTYVEASHKMTEVAARNRTLTMLGLRDWALIVDGDETMVGDHASVLELMAWVRSGVISEALGLSVYTGAVLFSGQAPQMSAAEYQCLPVVSTLGIQPRLFPRRDHVYRLAEGDRTPALYRDGEWVGSGQLVGECFLVNHRTRQTYDAYQNDYAWESAR